MPTQITDGTGSNRRAKVGSSNRLFTDSISNARVHVSAHVDEEVYTSVHQITPASPGASFLYLKNTHTSKDLTVWAWLFRSVSDEAIEVYMSEIGDPVGGASVIPANRVSGSGKVAQAVLQEGVNITGLDGILTDRFFYAGGNSSQVFQSLTGFILPPNTAMGFKAVNGGIQINMDLFIEFHEAEG